MAGFEIQFNGNTVVVTKSGQLVIAPLSYDQTSYNLLDVDGTIYNFYGPLPRKQFVITGFIAVGNKSIAGSPAEAVTEIFEANSEDADITNDAFRCLVKFAIATSQEISPSLNILVNPGVWVNATMNNDDVHLTLFGYYINEL